MKILSTRVCRFTLLAFTFLLCTAVAGNGKTADYNSMSRDELQKSVAALELGMDAYVIGKELTKEQQEISSKDDNYKAYPGTKKFKDGDLFVIADEKSHVIVAVYKRNTKATHDDFKQTVSSLMMQYGEPTAEAHGKTIYWNFGPEGFIPEELYRTVKSEGKLESLTILATVKFHSSENVASMTDMIGNMAKDGKAKKPKEETLSDNYVMIQSDLLTKKYINNVSGQ